MAKEPRSEKTSKLSRAEIKRRKAFLARVDALSDKIGPIGMTAAEMVKEGRHR